MKDEFWEEQHIAYRTNTHDKSRTTLVFIHGLGVSCSGWEPFEASLENDFNILTYDVRAHGFSRKYRNYADYDLEHLAEDLQALLNYLGIHSCTLVSNSMGTLIALVYQHRYPGAVQKNLFIAPIYKQHSVVGTTAKGILSCIIKLLGYMPFVPRSGKRPDYSRFTHTPDQSADRMLPEIRNVSWRLYLFFLARVYTFAEDDWWSQIRAPSTIMHGTMDTFAPYRLALELSRTIPDAKLVTLEGANHILVINNIPEIIELIRSDQSAS